MNLAKRSLTNLYTSADKSFEDAFDNDAGLAIFCAEWIKCGGNASKAYKRLHPEVTKASARVLGARQLAKVNIRDLLAVMGLNNAIYTHLLLKGLEATKYDSNYGHWVPDNATQFKYFTVLGRLLGLDNGPQALTAVFNNLNAQVNKE